MLSFFSRPEKEGKKHAIALNYTSSSFAAPMCKHSYKNWFSEYSTKRINIIKQAFKPTRKWIFSRRLRSNSFVSMLMLNNFVLFFSLLFALFLSFLLNSGLRLARFFLCTIANLLHTKIESAEILLAKNLQIIFRWQLGRLTIHLHRISCRFFFCPWKQENEKMPFSIVLTPTEKKM